MHFIAAICYNKCYEDDYCIQEERRCGWGVNLNLHVSKTNMQCLGCISQVAPKWHLGSAQAESAGLIPSLCALLDGVGFFFFLSGRRVCYELLKYSSGCALLWLKLRPCG